MANTTNTGMKPNQELVVRYTGTGRELTYFIREFTDRNMPASANANRQTVVATLTTAIAAELVTPPV